MGEAERGDLHGVCDLGEGDEEPRKGLGLRQGLGRQCLWHTLWSFLGDCNW